MGVVHTILRWAQLMTDFVVQQVGFASIMQKFIMHNTYQGLSYKGSSGEVIPCFKYSTTNFPLPPLQCILTLPNLTRESKNIFIPALFKLHRHLYPDRLSISVTQVLLLTHCAFIHGSENKYMRDQVHTASFLVHHNLLRSCKQVGKN